MSLKTTEKVLVFLAIVLVLAGVYVALRNLDFFVVDEISVTLEGPATGITTEMERIINPLKGRNIFEINLRNLERELCAIEGIEKARVSRYFPNRIELCVTFRDIIIKTHSTDSSAEDVFFLYDGTLLKVEQNVWESFDVSSVELNPAYSNFISKWGADEGFVIMSQLAQHLHSNNLISNIKYDNNNGNDFGRLVLEIPSCNAQLWIREQVSTNRLDEALEHIRNEFSSSGSSVRWDLYSNNELVRRI